VWVTQHNFVVARTGFAAGVVYFVCFLLKCVPGKKIKKEKTETVPVSGMYTSDEYQEFNLDLCQCR